MGKTRSSRMTSQVLRLQQGESLDLHLTRGDSVSVLRGRLRLARPAQWIGESLVQPAVELREGEQLLSTERGEAALQALSACELCAVCTVRVPLSRQVREFWSRLSARRGWVRTV